LCGEQFKGFYHWDVWGLLGDVSSFVMPLFWMLSHHLIYFLCRNRWTQMDLFGGSYSYVSVEQARANISHSRLSLPIRVNGVPRVLFAGEATHHRVFETAIGAFLSGRREADRIHSFMVHILHRGCRVNVCISNSLYVCYSICRWPSTACVQCVPPCTIRTTQFAPTAAHNRTEQNADTIEPS
jgi:hypothetical protein